MGTDNGTNGFARPYVSFKSLVRLFDRMGSEGIPARIDRSYLSGMSGGYQSQLLASLRVLGLIRDDGTVTEDLQHLASKPDERPEKLKTLLEGLYPKPIELGRVNATQAQLVEAFKEYGISGSTLRKAIAFYLEAAQFAGIPISPHFKPPKAASPNAGGVTKPRRPTRKPVKPQPPASPPPSGAGTHSIKLESGGVVTVIVSVDLFTLSAGDRQFVFDLIDKMREYAGKSPANTQVDDQ